MAKITRKSQKIFGSSAISGDVLKFGSEAAGLPIATTDPEIIQAGSAYLTAWRNATIPVNSQITPTLQDFNALEYNDTYQLAYLMQQGIAEWHTDTIYYIDSLCMGSDGKIYRSITDDNVAQDPVSDGGTNWVLFLLEANMIFNTLTGHTHNGIDSRLLLTCYPTLIDKFNYVNVSNPSLFTKTIDFSSYMPINAGKFIDIELNFEYPEINDELYIQLNPTTGDSIQVGVCASPAHTHFVRLRIKASVAHVFCEIIHSQHSTPISLEYTTDPVITWSGIGKLNTITLEIPKTLDSTISLSGSAYITKVY